MSSQPWTIDTLAHALPTPELRQEFLREAYLAPVDQLPDTLTPWVRFAERWQAGASYLDEKHAYIREHGEEPPELALSEQDVADSDAFLTRLEADAAQRRSDSSAA